ncbi:MAG: hypothetical protein E6Q97_23990 [Desulfurellales bacterium]|nr:MAG: hypothetical protein E6Q97_23990 [Desulfurellales bacterium]
MAKSVGSVEVQVGAKIDALQTELRKARGEVEKLTATHKREMAKAETASKGFTQSIGGIKTAIAGATVALGAMLVKSSTLGDQIAKTSQALGIGAEQYQAWGKSASLAGVDQSVFDRSLARLNRNIGDANRGLKTAVDAFERVGIATRNADGSARDAQSVFLELADKLSQVSSASDRAAIGAELLGDRTGRMTTFLAAGSAELGAMTEEMKRLGLIIDDRTLKAMELANDELDIMATRASVAGAKLSAALVPVLKVLSDTYTSVSNAVFDASQAMGAIGKQFGDSASQVRTLDDQIANLTAAVDGLRAKGGDALKGLTSPEVKQLMEFRRELEKVKATRDAITDSFSASPETVSVSASNTDKTTAEDSAKRTRSGDRLRGIFDARAAARAKVAEERRLRGSTDYKTGRPDLKNARRGVDEVRDASTEAIDELNRATDNFRVNLTDSLITGATEGFDGMLAGFSRTLQQMASDLLSSQLLRVLGSVGGGSSGGGGDAFGVLKKLGGAIVSAGSSLFGGGGLQEIDTSGFPARRAMGGPVMAGQTYMVGERGPELLQMGGKSGVVIPNNEIAGNNVTVQNNVTVNGNPDGATLLALKRALADNSRATIAQIAEMQRRGRFA